MLLWEDKFPPGKGECLEIFLSDIITCPTTKQINKQINKTHTQNTPKTKPNEPKKNNNNKKKQIQTFILMQTIT